MLRHFAALLLVPSMPIALTAQQPAADQPARILTFKQLVDSIAASNQQYEVLPAEQILRIATQLNGKPSHLDIVWKPNNAVAHFKQDLGFAIPPERMAAVESAVARMNHVFTLPGVGIDHANSRVYCYRVFLLRQEDGGIPERTVQIAFGECKKTAAVIANTLGRVIDGSVAPEDVLASSTEPPSVTEARKLLQSFLAPGADRAALSKRLRPQVQDYDRVFKPQLAALAKAFYGPLWDGGLIEVAPNPGQTEVLVVHATTEELVAGTGKASAFPGGYKQVSAQLQPGVVFHRFKFVEPGATLGMGFDGLVQIDGRWVLFPKPWKALASE